MYMQSISNQQNTKQSSSVSFSLIVSLLLITAGLYIAGYLLNHYLQLNANGGRSNDVCSTVFGKSCDAALNSNYSTVLGLPLAAWGILYYTAIILFWLIPILFGDDFKKLMGMLIYTTTLMGVMAALVLLALMLIQPEVFCPLCSILHGINIALFFFINHANGISRKEVFPAIKSWVKIIFSKKISQPMIRWKLFGISSIMFLLVSIYFGLYMLTLKTKEDSGFIDAKKIFNEFYSQPIRQIPVDADDPINGPENSNINIVVFSDFFCPACKRFSQDLQRVIDEGKGNYSIVFKHFPLSTDCNNGIGENLHPLACQAAYAGVIAQMQGKFWAFHDTIFNAPNLKQQDFIRSMALRSGLNLQHFDSLRHDVPIKEKVSRDIALAQSLKIDATPTVFLNGRLVTDMRKGIFEVLVHQELKRIHRADSLSNLR